MILILFSHRARYHEQFVALLLQWFWNGEVRLT